MEVQILSRAQMNYVIGIDEVGRAAPKGRASPKTKFVIGIDEVGRGSLAGPVAVAAVALPENLGLRNRNLGQLRDSKKLTALARERWFEHVKRDPKISYVVARVYPRGIERMNIAKAANLAALRAFTRLVRMFEVRVVRGGNLRSSNKHGDRTPSISNAAIFLDGGLYVKNKTYSAEIGAKTVVRGDEKITAIKLASIVAKVTRDRAMVRLAKRYPRYGFEIHKGYGTRTHLAAMRKYGQSDVHRLTFLGRFRTLRPANRV